jgi:aspartyl-tRNA synthetase
MRTSLRTHTCGALRRGDVGAVVSVCGWVQARRDQGGVVFVDLRDRHGVTQVTFRDDQGTGLVGKATAIKPEWVIRVTGTVAARPDNARNANMPTGEIEVEATALEVLAECPVPPFWPTDRTEASTDLRLEWRFMDLRRPKMTRAIVERAHIVSTFRRRLEEQGFLEVETPLLTRSTPEGSRDFLVPSRLHAGSFYALPQSPQLFKQLLMVSGFDRYYQVARCIRDEDSRADRQPEFSQVDIEASFVNEADVQAWIEPVIAELVKRYRGVDLPSPLPRHTYDDVMERYGSDKPDLRNPLVLVDVSAPAAAIGLRIFSDAVGKGGVVNAMRLPGGAALPRKDVDGWEAEAKAVGAGGLAWAKVGPEGVSGSVAKFLAGEPGKALLAACGATTGDLVLFGAGSWSLVKKVLGHLRKPCAERLNLIDRTKVAALWVTDFPLVEWNEDEKRWDACHHPFTSAREQDWALIEEYLKRKDEPGFDGGSLLKRVRARAYDLVVDGSEAAGGSIRIHRPELQQKMFALLGLAPDDVERRFGWFVNALRYGAPPHGGIALGVDRLVMLMLGEEAIQEVIAFPKTAQARCLLTRAPATVDEKQLRDLHIALLPPKA